MTNTVDKNSSFFEKITTGVEKNLIRFNDDKGRIILLTKALRKAKAF
jgi:hypothetical protein